MTANSIEIVSRLIRKEFDCIEKEIWNDDRGKELIQTAKDFGLVVLADEMQNGLN